MAGWSSSTRPGAAFWAASCSPPAAVKVSQPRPSLRRTRRDGRGCTFPHPAFHFCSQYRLFLHGGLSFGYALPCRPRLRLPFAIEEPPVARLSLSLALVLTLAAHVTLA